MLRATLSAEQGYEHSIDTSRLQYSSIRVSALERRVWYGTALLSTRSEPDINGIALDTPWVVRERPRKVRRHRDDEPPDRVCTFHILFLWQAGVFFRILSAEM